MNAPGRLQAMPANVRESRKIWGLLIVIGAVLVALATFLAASAALAIGGHPGALDWTPVRDTMAFITGNGLFHQFSQGASDVAKWRSAPPSQPGEGPRVP